MADMTPLRLTHGLPLALVALASLMAVGATYAQPSLLETSTTTALPDDDPRSGRFINLTRGLSSLGETGTHLSLMIPGSQPTFSLELFDGDMGGKWDPRSGGPSTLDLVRYTLYADPTASNATSVVVGRWLSSAMPDDGWWQATVAQSPAALSGNGDYHYNLVLNWVTTLVPNEQNNFKIRVEGLVYLLANSTYGFIGYGPNDPLPSVFPATTYDGTWRFMVEVPSAARSLDFWDGDFDRTEDTDDPLTPARPPFACASTTLDEGAHEGSPSDDSPTEAFRISPSIRVVVTAPDGLWSVAKDNPSGNQEWELFRISTDPTDTTAHAIVDSIPAGLYEWKVEGADDRNTVFITPRQDLYPELCSTGDWVWNDANLNGVQDDDETGVAGVPIALFVDGDTTAFATTVTDAQGNYRFDHLPPGEYHLQFGLPAGWARTTPDQGGDDLADSDASLVDGSTVVTELRPNEDDLSWDAGIYKLASIGDRVWNDADYDGVQGSGEAGLADVTVTLLGADGSQLATTTTDADGNYLFGGLMPGDYYVVFGELPGYARTKQDEGSDDAIDSDADETSGKTAVIALAPGQDDLTWDAGLVQLASLGDFVWNDVNRDGIQDAGEVGLGGVEVTLYAASGDTVGTTVTAADGSYSFTDLLPGSYYVQFGGKSGYLFTVADQGSDDAVDSDADATSGQTAVFALAAGAHDTTWDAGLFTWGDVDVVKTGSKLAGNCRTIGFWKANITKHLASSAEQPRGTQVTKTQLGEWLRAVDAFHLLSVLDLGPNGASLTTLMTNAKAILSYIGSDMVEKTKRQLLACELNALSGVFAMDDRAAHLAFCGHVEDAIAAGDVDLGPLHDLCDQINNLGDGVADASVSVGDTLVFTITVTADMGLAGQCEVRDYLDSCLAFISADQGGAYASSGHYVSWMVDLPAGKSTTELHVWVKITALPSGDSDGNPGTGWSFSDWYTVDVCSGGDDGGCGSYSGPARCSGGTGGDPGCGTCKQLRNRATWHHGDEPVLGSIGDLVWSDTTPNGVQDAGEPGVEGVTVTLYDAAANALATTTTNADGKYLFSGLQPGDYSVGFTAPAGWSLTAANQGTDDATDSDAAVADGRTAVTHLDAGETDTTWDAGLQAAPVSKAAVQKFGGKFTGGCLSPGFWKTNIEKHLASSAEKPNGTQMTKTQLLSWLRAVDAYYRLDVMDLGDSGANPTTLLTAAKSIMAYNGSDMALKLRRELLASELNLVSVTYAMADPTVHAALVCSAEDALATGSADLGTLHDLLSAANVLGDSAWTTKLYVGDQVLFGITVTADLAADTTIEIRDYLDQALTFLGATSGGAYVSAGRYVKWSPVLPAGQGATATVLLWAKLTGDPGAAGTPSGDWAVSNTIALTVYPSATYTASQTSSSGADRCTTGGGGTLRNTAYARITHTGTGGSICDMVWNDANADGCWDAGEGGRKGVGVCLKSAKGTTVACTTTDSQGRFAFTNLSPGSYTIQITPPSGCVQTYDATPPLDDCSAVAVTAGHTCTGTGFGYMDAPTHLVTYSQADWGASPKRSDAAALLAKSFGDVYSGGASVGGAKSVRFTTADAICAFLPTSGRADSLRRSATDPTDDCGAGVLAGEVLALQLNVDFSASGVLPAGLPYVKVVGGSFAGWRVSELLALANAVLGGDTSGLPPNVSKRDLANALAAVNAGNSGAAW